MINVTFDDFSTHRKTIITLENNRSGRVLLELLKRAFELRKLTPGVVSSISSYRDQLDRVDFFPFVLDLLNEIGITMEDLPEIILENIAPYNGEYVHSPYLPGAIEPAF